jgi:transcriptional regulator with XRE-family HTH domain
MANILSIKEGLVNRVRQRRREGKISQAALAEKSGVSLGSVKRFEGSGDISLSSLLRIAVVLGYEADFDNLFVRVNYQSIEDVINAK